MGEQQPVDAEAQLPWYTKFGRHLWALSLKNVSISLRNPRSFFARITAAFWFLLLLWLSDKAIQADNDSLSEFKEVRRPEPEQIKAIPACEQDTFYQEGRCYDFIYTPSSDPVVEEIVAHMLSTNPGRAIPQDKVLGLASPSESNAYLSANTETTQGAVHFQVNSLQDITFTVQTNSTPKYWKGDFASVSTFIQLPLQVSAHSAIMAVQLQSLGTPLASDPSVWVSEFAHPALQSLSIVSTAGSIFLYAACMFGFIMLLSAVVSERESGMKQSLRTLGMLDSAYYASWLLWELVLVLVTTFIIMISGYIFGFQIMKDNNFFVSFFLYFLFQLAISGVAIFFTPFLRRSTQAIYLGFLVFLVGWIMQLVVAFGYPYSADYKDDPVYAIFSLFPWTLFVKGMRDLDDMSSRSRGGISWSSRSSYCVEEEESVLASGCNGNESLCECVMPLGTIYGILFAQFLVYTILGLYLDLVLPDGNGSRHEVPWFFLLPRYWIPSLGGRYGRKAASSSDDPQHALSRFVELRPTVPVPGAAGDASVHRNGDAPPTSGDPAVHPLSQPQGSRSLSGRDRMTASERGLSSVREEQARLEALLTHVGDGRHTRVMRRVPNTDAAHESAAVEDLPPSFASLEVFGLQKRFGRDFWAVLENWFDVQEGQIFCLLGPNGAGKTTTIKCLTGVQTATGGDAIINGHPLRSPAALNSLRASIGVCPQFDVLWPELSGRQHARIFAWIKGVPKAQVNAAADAALEQVALMEAADGRTSTYSGGMRRRLSVALAFIGNPKVVFLDEASTGMDPVARRQVWDIIEAAKPGRAIVLTTHSMEEADVLGDRIGIMALGRMRALGSSISLKRIFGSGYRLTFVLKRDASQQARQNVKTYVAERLGLQPQEENEHYLLYQVPLSAESTLADLLRDLKSSDLAVSDVQVGMSSLEEVFLAIARQAQIEAARDTSAMATFTDPAGHVHSVPLGADTITHPETGATLQVVWGQDAEGRLVLQNLVPAQ